MSNCVFCVAAGETILWRNERCRVLLADEPGYPGFCRVVWNEHVAEMTDLPEEDRVGLMAVVFGVEAAVREVLTPDKVNLATLGNRVPHVHWHVIPRFRDDPTFPDAVWGAPIRSGTPGTAAFDPARLAEAIGRKLGSPVTPPGA